jgi:hypothetical protein
VSLRLYMDHQVHGSITDGLRHRGVDVITAHNDGRRRASDPELLTRAGELRRLFFSHDSDLLIEACRRQLAREHFFGLAYAHELNITIGQAIECLELMCEIYDPADVENQVIYLPF